ncbi:hypothetical protein NDU88_007818 [Pleurodeles waltl]|uniref:Uncharacterized protein n=1 Tax=Pleurodeles waltl TaxID=8319 RepID=A0AAV7PNN6_PLEWA|nr:hypothetical protein NDU88_007818 [Pleurodeles waltl]
MEVQPFPLDGSVAQRVKPLGPGRRRGMEVKARPREAKGETLHRNLTTEDETRGQRSNTEEEKNGGGETNTEEEMGFGDGQQGAPKRTEHQGE